MNIVPRYAHIKTQTHNTAARKTQIQAQTLQIKNKIKFLYKKRQKLNKELYYTHMEIHMEQHRTINKSKTT
jgi:hypothetical protein